jgi:hypothetical protein
MSDYNLTPSAILERTKIDVSATAGTKTLHGMTNFDAFASRNDNKGLPKSLIIAAAILVAAAMVAAAFLVRTLLG